MAKTCVRNDKITEAIGLVVKKSNGTADCGYELMHTAEYPNQGKNLPLNFCKALIPDSTFYEELSKPDESDWLANHRETGQTFKSYIKGGLLRPSPRRNTIYLLPLVFNEDPVPEGVLQPLQRFASMFFGLEVKLMKRKNLKGKVTDRINSGIYQVHAGEVIHVMRDLIPGDAFCVAGITLCDLYPREAWNFVFGLANLSGRCGVYSMARYLSDFGKHRYTKYQPEKESDKTTTLVRACKTMCHEIGHMFGLKHCVYFSCIMNGSNHLEESDARSIFLCPVCLRKLHFACQFDLLRRYNDMKQFWTDVGLERYIDWLQRRIDFITMSE